MEISPIQTISGNQDVGQVKARNIAARNAAEQFEAVMLSQSFSQMFKGVKGPSMAGGGQSEKIWQSLMIDEMAKGVAKSGGVGIADKIYKDLAR